MAEKPRKDQKKKTRRRKVRRDVDISSSSSSSEDESSATSEVQSAEQPTSDVEMTEDQAIQEIPEATLESQPKEKKVSEEDFNSWYLRQVAKELEEDLDKQGGSLFTKEEKQRIMGAL